jgi:3-phosphoshikimate 1-carboxyvinyltransferase
MKVKIYPGKLQGIVNVPQSKSLTHRALICASLCNTTSTINNYLTSEDTIATINCLCNLGVKIKQVDDKLIINGVSEYKIQGLLNVKDSASSLRFLLPLISLFNDNFRIYASRRLIERINTVDLDSLRGLHFTFGEDYVEVKGKLLNTDFQLSDEITSQWISGLMLTLPFTKSRLKINSIESNYIKMTMAMMKDFGIKLDYLDNYISCLDSNYQSQEITIEGDLSSAAFLLTMAILNNEVRIQDLNLNSLQGDLAFLDYVKQMGINYQVDEGLHFINTNPKSHEFDLTYTPDLAPVLAALASVSDGKTIIRGLKKLKYKESNRIEATYESLKNLGADIKIDGDDLIINGIVSLNGDIEVNSYNDHRIVMSLVAIASRIKKPFTILQADAVNKSFPNFFTLFKNLGGKYENQI